MNNKKLELRMYGLVNYQLTGIQVGIQYTHAIVEYGLKYNNELFQEWAKNHKTCIILNGKTTNTNPNRLGEMNKSLQLLIDNNIDCATFYEPDLGDQLTAIVFIVDERVFNNIDYPYYEELSFDLDDQNTNTQNYKNWVENIGGEKNAFLKDFLRGFKLHN
ncbi:MAG: hypothetical protein M0R46_13300 [Candidatus Muirbacterium halophilum]|nr:hypothetical protein [Candidatus Muirbacterium halophilum]